MSFLDTLESWISTEETQVLLTVAKINAGLVVIEKDVAAGISWLASHLGQINQDAQYVLTAMSYAQAAGITLPSNVTSTVQEINAAVVGINAFVTASNAGQTNAAALVQGYLAAKNLQGSISATAAAIAALPTASPAAAQTPATAAS